MRKLIVANMMSLDGFYTGPGGDVMVLPDYDSFDLYNVERLRVADTLLLDEAALRHGAGVAEETIEADVAYARFPDSEPTRYRDGWLPGN